VFVNGERVFVEYRFGLGLNRVLDWFEICRFSKDRIFYDSGQARYHTNTDVLDGFDAFPMWGTNEGHPRGASISKDGR